MLLKEIYDRPIDRTINPAVVVGNRKEETIRTEIEEYVFTDDVINNLYKALKAIKEKGQVDKTGIWINGYYGSGKSHFIKFLHYLIDEETSGRAFERYIEDVKEYDPFKVGNEEDITQNNIALLQKWYRQAKVQDIMFNVEDETDDGSGERLTRIFLSMFNRFRGYNSDDIPLAILFEKYLDKEGVFEDFKKVMAEAHGYDWETQAADVVSFELQTALEEARKLAPDLDVTALHTKLSNPETYRITINTLTREINEFLKEQPDDYRLLFLVDEISQYVGGNREILLNLENIVERLSNDCDKKVWVACTAQQTLEHVTSETGLSEEDDEFGKILGRFETRISLESTDASYITQKRVLDKNSKGLEVLTDLYHQNKDAIEHQFQMQHDLYKGFREEDDFIMAYPFVPYQFKLIAHVFEAFQNLGFVIKEVKDNERSVLGITHFTAKENAEKAVGHFIPFDAFYNSQFATNLTQRGRRAVENALQLTKDEPFARRVVKTLFMISNLSDSVKMTFPSNLDNLTVLMMTDLDQNKLELQQNIKTVLEFLMEESIIREEKGSYFFFSEDEIDVTNLIKNKIVNQEFRWTELDKLLRPMLRVDRKYRLQNSDFRIAFWIDDKEFIRNGDVMVKVLAFDQGEVHQKALGNSDENLLICIYEWFNQDKALRKDFERYCKAEKYFREDTDGVQGIRAKTVATFKERNQLLRDKIKETFEIRFSETRFISGQQVIEPNEVAGSKPQDRYRNALEKHLNNVFKYHKLAHDYAATSAELRQAARQNWQGEAYMKDAEQLVQDHISNHGDSMTVADIIRNFEKAPFGWKDTAIIHILIQLARKKKRELVYANHPRYAVAQFVEKAISTAERQRCEVIASAEISQELIDDTLQAYRTIFNTDLPHTTDGNQLFDSLKAKLEERENHYRKYEEKFLNQYPFGIHFKELCQTLHSWGQVREPERLFQTVTKEADTAKDKVDTCKGLIHFADRGLEQYDAIQRWYEANKENFKDLDPADLEKADRIGRYFKSDTPARDFRHINKAYDELRKALDHLVEDLRIQVVNTYNNIFDELREEAENAGVEEANVYADRDHWLRKIEQEPSVTFLRYYRSDAGSFKSRELEKIFHHAAQQQAEAEEAGQSPGGNGRVGEPQEYYLSRVKSVIRSEEELEEYLEQVKKDMLELLKEKKTIIIK